MYFTFAEARDLLGLFAGDPDIEITVIEAKKDDRGHSGPGLYACFAEYPDEGYMLLGEGRQTTGIF